MKVHHDVKTYAMKSRLTSKVRCDVKMFIVQTKRTSWHQKVRHDVKRYVIAKSQKSLRSIKIYIKRVHITYKRTPWHYKRSMFNMSKSMVSTSLHQNIMPWNQKVCHQKYVMTSRSTWCEKNGNTSWGPNLEVCHNVKKYFVTSKLLVVSKMSNTIIMAPYYLSSLWYLTKL